MFRNLIFDWSGTLCDDLELTIEATNYVLSHYGIPPLDKATFRAEFQLPYPAYYARKTPGVPLEELENHYRCAFDRSATKVSLLPHAAAFLRFCAARGIRCFVLTSMDPPAFLLQAKELGVLSFFEHVHSGIRHKDTYITGLMQQHALNPEETAFIGDMQHDIHAAHSAGITSVAVLTGYNNAAQLAEAEPDLIIPDLRTLQNLLSRSSAAPRPSDDCICINGMELSCHIGVPAEERATPQRLLLNVRLTPPNPFSTLGDSLPLTIDYDSLSRRLRHLAESSPSILLETLAHRLATACTREFGALSATVELHKFILPSIHSTSVRTTSHRTDE